MNTLARTSPINAGAPINDVNVGQSTQTVRVLHVLPSLVGGGMERTTIRLIRGSRGAGVSPAFSNTSAPSHLDLRVGCTSPERQRRVGTREVLDPSLALGASSSRLPNAAVEAPAYVHGLCILQGADRELLAECRPAAQLWVFGGGAGAPKRLSSWWRLRRVIRRFRPDVVHARSTGVWVDAAMATRGLARVRLLLSFHGKTHTGRPGLRRRLLNRWAAARADAVLAVSNESATYMEREWGVPGAKLRAIHNGVDVERFRPATMSDEPPRVRGELGLSAGHRLAICVANLLPIKGIDVLLRAWQRVHAQQPAARLLLVGDGPLRSELQALAWELGCRDSVLFAGDRENVAELLRAADLFVLPSHYEACSNAILEAQASGLPVIACDTGGNPELITTSLNGWLVPPGSPEALAERTLAVLADDELRRQAGRAARQWAVTACSQSAWLKAYSSLYLSLATTGSLATAGISGPEAKPCAE